MDENNARRWTFTGFISGYRCTKQRPPIAQLQSSNERVNMPIGIDSSNLKCSLQVQTVFESRRRWWLPSLFRSPKIAPIVKESNHELDINKCHVVRTISPVPLKSLNLLQLDTGGNKVQQLSTTDHLLTFIKPDELRSLSRLSQGTENKYNPQHTPTKVAKAQQQQTAWPITNGSPPTFQTIGHNGNQLIENLLLSKGWNYCPNSNQCDVKFLWGENLSQIKIWDFKEGDQMVNHIPNSHYLSNKLCLLRCLQDYSAIKVPSRKTGLRIIDFVPETYRLDLKQDRYIYTQRHKNGDMWICKPAMLNQGKGIFLVRSCEELRCKMKVVEAEEQAKIHFSKPANVRIIQRYISSPLLLEGRKADIRSFMLIACAKPYVVLFHHGYVRLSCNQYDLSCTDLNTHLTNQCMQRKSPKYEDMKEDTVWDMSHLNEYITYFESPPHDDWVHTTFREQMCRIMLHCFHAAKSKLDRRLGLFELFGFDFLIDSSYKVWLLEININPSLQDNCQVLKMVLPSVLDETVDIVHECFEKGHRGMRILPLQSQREFVLLYCEEMPYIKTIPPCKTISKTKIKNFNASPC